MWNCSVDDPRFSNINLPQWLWYSEMINQEKENAFEKDLLLVEYLASFWNSEAVKKIREARSARDLHAFKDDKEFEQSVINNEYKNNPLLDALKKIKQMEQKELDESRKLINPRKSKPPTNLSDLSRMIKKF